MGHFARIWFRIDAATCDLNFVVLALAIHLRVDAKASCACEDLQCFHKPLGLCVGLVSAGRQPETFLDDHFEKVILRRINLNYSTQLRRDGFKQDTGRLDQKRVENFRYTTGCKDGGDNIGDRIPQRIFFARVNVIDAYLPIVACWAELAADWQQRR